MAALGSVRYRDANPVPTSPFAATPSLQGTKLMSERLIAPVKVSLTITGQSIPLRAAILHTRVKAKYVNSTIGNCRGTVDWLFTKRRCFVNVLQNDSTMIQ